MEGLQFCVTHGLDLTQGAQADAAALRLPFSLQLKADRLARVQLTLF